MKQLNKFFKKSIKVIIADKTIKSIIFMVSTFVVLTILALHLDSIIALFRPSDDIWRHIRNNLLWEYTRNTVSVVMLSMIVTGVLGTILAYFNTCFDYPLRKVVSVLLYIPLAIPPYINAFIYMDILGPNGLFHRATGINPRFGALPTSVLVFSITLLPYVYITVAGFIKSGMSNYIENARLLKQGEVAIFTRVILPIAKTAILTGMILVGLEVMGDFGVANYLGLHTFGTAIIHTLANFRSIDSSLRLSGVLMVPVFALLMIKGLFLRSKLSQANAKSSIISKRQLKGIHTILPITLSFFVIFFSLVLPFYRLITWAMMSYNLIRYSEIFTMLFNSIWVSVLVSAIILILALIIATYVRTARKSIGEVYGKLTLISYALPGSVIAIIVMLFFITLDRNLNSSLSNTMFILIFAYVVRYLGVAYENIENGYKKVGTKYHEASRTIGKNYIKTLLTVDLPLLKPFIMSASSLVFIDMVKELPLTWVLRPFNFETIVTLSYRYASDEMVPLAAIPSLIIIAISMTFIYSIVKE